MRPLPRKPVLSLSLLLTALAFIFITPLPSTTLLSADTPVNNAEFVSWDVPGVMIAGQILKVSITMKNTGTTTWTPLDPSPYKLGSQNPADNIIWKKNGVRVLQTVAPGTEVTFFFKITVPAQAGTYPFQWQMDQQNIGWFGAKTPNKSILVIVPPTTSVSLAAVSDARDENSTILTWSQGVPRSVTTSKGIFSLSVNPATILYQAQYDLNFKQVGQSTWQHLQLPKAIGIGGTPVLLADRNDNLHILLDRREVGQTQSSPGCEMGSNLHHYIVNTGTLLTNGQVSITEVDHGQLASQLWGLDHKGDTICIQRMAAMSSHIDHALYLGFYAFGAPFLTTHYVIARYDYDAIPPQWNRAVQVPSGYTDAKCNATTQDGCEGVGASYGAISQTSDGRIYAMATPWRGFTPVADGYTNHMYRQVDVVTSSDQGQTWDRTTLCTVPEDNVKSLLSTGNRENWGCLGQDLFKFQGKMVALYYANAYERIGAVSPSGAFAQSGYYVTYYDDLTKQWQPPTLVADALDPRTGPDWSGSLIGDSGNSVSNFLVLMATKAGRLGIWRSQDVGRSWEYVGVNPTGDLPTGNVYQPQTIKPLFSGKNYSTLFGSHILGIVTDRWSVPDPLDPSKTIWRNRILSIDAPLNTVPVSSPLPTGSMRVRREYVTGGKVPNTSATVAGVTLLDNAAQFYGLSPGSQRVVVTQVPGYDVVAGTCVASIEKPAQCIVSTFPLRPLCQNGQCAINAVQVQPGLSTKIVFKYIATPMTSTAIQTPEQGEL